MKFRGGDREGRKGGDRSPHHPSIAQTHFVNPLLVIPMGYNYKIDLILISVGAVTTSYPGQYLCASTVNKNSFDVEIVVFYLIIKLQFKFIYYADNP